MMGRLPLHLYQKSIRNMKRVCRYLPNFKSISTPLISTNFDELTLFCRLLKISFHIKKSIQIRSPSDESRVRANQTPLVLPLKYDQVCDLPDIVLTEIRQCSCVGLTSSVKTISNRLQTGLYFRGSDKECLISSNSSEGERICLNFFLRKEIFKRRP